MTRISSSWCWVEQHRCVILTGIIKVLQLSSVEWAGRRYCTSTPCTPNLRGPVAIYSCLAQSQAVHSFGVNRSMTIRTSGTVKLVTNAGGGGGDIRLIMPNRLTFLIQQGLFPDTSTLRSVGRPRTVSEILDIVAASRTHNAHLMYIFERGKVSSLPQRRPLDAPVLVLV